MVVDAMLARVLAMTLCPAVSASVTSRSSIETAEQIELFFCMEAFFDLSYTVVRKFRYLTIRVLPSPAMSQTPDLENFATAYGSSKRVIRAVD